MITIRIYIIDQLHITHDIYIFMNYNLILNDEYNRE